MFKESIRGIVDAVQYRIDLELRENGYREKISEIEGRFKKQSLEISSLLNNMDDLKRDRDVWKDKHG